MVHNLDNSMIDNLPRLQWACRRGMLELDVLLSNFLNEAYSSLSLVDKQRFVKLLSFPDPDIFAWLMGHGQPDDEDMILITERMRQHARSRF